MVRIRDLANKISDRLRKNNREERKVITFERFELGLALCQYLKKIDQKISYKIETEGDQELVNLNLEDTKIVYFRLQTPFCYCRYKELQDLHKKLTKYVGEYIISTSYYELIGLKSLLEKKKGGVVIAYYE